MKNKTLLILGIVYFIAFLIGIIFLFNNFTKSAEQNFIFRVIAIVLFCLCSSFPIVVATSKNISTPSWVKVLLYFGYAVIAGFSLFFAFKTFGDNSFMYNINLTQEAFKNSQRNLTSTLWICLLLSLICLIPVLSVKMGKRWPDWLFIFLVPFSLAIVGLFVGAIVVLLIYWIIKGIASSSSSVSYAGSSSYSTDSSSDYDDSNEDVEETDSSSSSSHGYLRSSGDRFYDGKGYLRDPGERFYDSQGYLRDPGERFYDGKGILRDPGERYYDSEGILRDPGENYYDGGN